MSERDAGPLVRVGSLAHRYGSVRRWALRDVSFDVERGRILGIAGPNGSGKTTLFRLVLGFVRPVRGAITIAGLRPVSYRVRRGIGYVPEQIRLPPRIRVREFASLVARMARLTRAETPSAVDRLTAELELEDAVGREVAALSHGYRRRVGLMAALLGEPELLVMDEPSNGLDPGSLGVLRGVLRALKRQGRTVLIASHNLLELGRVCDEVLVLSGGRVLGRESRNGLLGRGRVWVVRLGDSRPAAGRVFDRARRELSGVRVASDEAAFLDRARARGFVEAVKARGVRIERVERRPFDMELFFHTLVGARCVDTEGAG